MTQEITVYVALFRYAYEEGDDLIKLCATLEEAKHAAQEYEQKTGGQPLEWHCNKGVCLTYAGGFGHYVIEEHKLTMGIDWARAESEENAR